MDTPLDDDALARALLDRGRAQDLDGARALRDAHADRLKTAPQVAFAWLQILALARRDDEDVRAEAELILDAWPLEPRLVTLGAELLLDPIDGRPGDEPIPEDDPALPAAARLGVCIEHLEPHERRDPEIGGRLLGTLGNALRQAGEAHTAAAEAALREAAAIGPAPAWAFDLGLLLKHRGRFAEALEQFQAWAAASEPDAPILWNLGICATGAGEPEVAAQAWRQLGMQAQIGRAGHAEVQNLGRVKVRLRGADAEGEPRFEHVWVQPHSPCHGEVLNATLYDACADRADLVLWDGAPVGFVEHEGVRVPRFPALARLAEGPLRGFAFRAEQPAPGVVADLVEALGDGVEIVVFDETVERRCAACIRGEGPHADHPPAPPPEGPHRVHGKLCCPPADVAEVAAALAVVAGAAGVRLAAPDLIAAAGGDVAAAASAWEALSPGVASFAIRE
ncbi:MAG: hypothetical protein H6704_28505 [Myxococcales bacterium]|nr:hypothetical protein [Myxococcales bacterium]